MKSFLKKHWIKITLAIFAIPVAGYFVICFSIGHGVRSVVSDASALYPGDPVSSLMALATSEDAPLKDRDRAIWALGQLGSARALPALYSLETGETCNHETAPCQHELNKAITACSSRSPNLGAWVWRHGELAVAGGD
jgi:hypothetical protein